MSNQAQTYNNLFVAH